tara:strand:+ start:6079 stop:6951 length:873 start_codon:yes stop_codon:yes gene_type:complete
MGLLKKIKKSLKKKKENQSNNFYINRVNITYSSDQKRPHGKVALILGASSGIGKATAISMAYNGARVVIAARREELLKEVKDEINNIAPNICEYVICDVLDLDQIKKTVEFTVKKFDKIDVAVNNFGVSFGCNITEITEEKYNNVLDINTKAVLFALKHQIQQMLLQKNTFCSIINIGSTLSLTGFTNASLYSASKHAIVGITKSVALERNPNIRINCVCPGSVKGGANSSMGPNNISAAGEFNLINQRYPVGHIGKPEEVDSVVSFIASDEASYVNGAIIPVDGGFTAY